MDADEEELSHYLGKLIQQIENGELAGYDDYIIDSDGETRGVYYTIMENGWYSIITRPYSNVLRNMNWLFLAFTVVIGLFLLMVAAMTWRKSVPMPGWSVPMRRSGCWATFYYALYRVDYGQGTYETIKGSDYVRARLPETGNYEDLQRVIGEVIQPEAYEEYMRSFSRESIQSLVSRRVRDFGGEFLRRFGEEYRWVSVRVLFDESLAPEEVVLSFREVEEEKQGQLRERKLLQDALELARQNEAAKQSFFQQHVPRYAYAPQCHYRPFSAGCPARRRPGPDGGVSGEDPLLQPPAVGTDQRHPGHVPNGAGRSSSITSGSI